MNNETWIKPVRSGEQNPVVEQAFAILDEGRKVEYWWVLDLDFQPVFVSDETGGEWMMPVTIRVKETTHESN